MAMVPYCEKRWAYAHRDPTTREPVPGRTYGTENPGCPAHIASIPVSRSPYYRPFFAFVNCKPTPPPRSLFYGSSATSGEERARRIREAQERALEACLEAEALYDSYDSEICEDTVSYTPEEADNDFGDDDDEGHDDTGDYNIGGEIFENTLPPGIMRTTFTTTISTVKAEFSRAKSVHVARRKRFLFWADGVSYHLKLRRQTAFIKLRLLLDHFKPILLKYFFILIACVVLLSLGVDLVTDWLGDDGVLDGEIIYFLVDDYKSRCVAA